MARVLRRSQKGIFSLTLKIFIDKDYVRLAAGLMAESLIIDFACQKAIEFRLYISMAYYLGILYIFIAHNYEGLAPAHLHQPVKLRSMFRPDFLWIGSITLRNTEIEIILLTFVDSVTQFIPND